MNLAVEAPTLDEIRASESRLTGLALRTPLIRLNYPNTPSDIYLKLENLQPVVAGIMGPGGTPKPGDGGPKTAADANTLV